MRSGLRIFAALLLLTLVSFAQQHTKRLVLKDGGFQPITEYKLEGDRVRYFSAERFMWEEMPKELVDWEATEKYNANPVKNDRSQDNRELAEEEARERAKSEADAPTVAPGLRLPGADLGGVYLLDQWQGHPELAEIVQNGADVAKNTGKNAARVTINPLATKHQTFTLQGAHARVQSHVSTPTIFVCLQSSEKSVDVASHYRIVEVESDAKKSTRSVGTLNVKLSGKTSQSQRFVPSTAAKVNEGPWVKVTPSQPLPPGEYAVVEMLGEGDMNLFVWDFGVNPEAPENLNATKPASLRQSGSD
jgi:hypothetical protein